MSKVTKIQMYEQVGRGNFAGDTDEAQGRAANNFARILTEKMTEYCKKNYLDADLKIDFNVENVSGCTKHFESFVTTDDDNTSEEIKIQDEIQSEYDSICSSLERSGEIYE